MNAQNTDNSPPPLPPWPRDEGWDFRPGEASLDGQRFKIVGKLRGLLEVLAAAAGAPVRADRLKREVWHEDPEYVEDGNLQGHVSLLRKRLREALGLAREFDPVPFSDGAYRLAVY